MMWQKHAGDILAAVQIPRSAEGNGRVGNTKGGIHAQGAGGQGAANQVEVRVCHRFGRYRAAPLDAAFRKRGVVRSAAGLAARIIEAKERPGDPGGRRVVEDRAPARRKCGWQPEVVGVQEGEPLAMRLVHARIPGPGYTLATAVCKDADARVQRG